MKTNAAIYIRKSREDKNKEAFRLAYQREQLPAYATSKGWQVEVYDDGHASAARGKTDDLRERSRLEQDIRRKRVDLILVIELSRLSRDDTLQDYIAWLTLCADQKVKLATMTRVLDPSEHSDWMLLLMEGGFSSIEMKVITSRMAEGRRHAFMQGKFMGGWAPLPYIYSRSERKPVVDQRQLDKMREIWGMAERMSAKAIAEKLGKAEITIRRMISDERLLFYQGLRLDPVSQELMKCDWEPVMTPEQADRIRTGRKARKNNPMGVPTHALLSGLGILKCGYCGRTIKTWNNSKTRLDGSRLNYYGCQVKNRKGRCVKSRLIAQNILDDKVATNMFHVLADIWHLKEYWEAEQAGMDLAGTIQEVEKAENELKIKKARLVSAIADGVLELGDAKESLDTIKAQLEELNSNKMKLIDSAENPPDWKLISFERYEFESTTFELKRELLCAIFEEIRVFESYAILVYRFPRNDKGDHMTRIHLPKTKRNSVVKRC